MHRRTYLAATVSGLAAAATAGCLSLPDTGVFGDSTDDHSQNVGRTFDPSSTARTVTIGSRDAVVNPESTRPHRVLLWNAAPNARSIAVTVREQSRGQAFHGTVSVPSEAMIEVVLAEPGSYDLALQVVETAHREMIEVPEHWFDCNASTFSVTIPRAGEVTVTKSSTLVACGSPLADN